jgi:hypothetical protein
MNTKLREVLQRAERWPLAAQEAALDFLLEMEAELSQPPILTDEDREALARSAEDVRLGRFASEEEVREVFSRHRG